MPRCAHLTDDCPCNMIQPTKPPKIIIVEWAQDLFDPDTLIAYTANGGCLKLRTGEVHPKHRTRGRLYTDGHGHFFSRTRWGIREVFIAFSPSHRTPGRQCYNGQRGKVYPEMRNFGNVPCHIFVCTVFHGPRPVFPDGTRAECDHKNGNIFDFSPENLEWVHHSVNRWRAGHVTQIMQRAGINPKDYSGKQMDRWFVLFHAMELGLRPPALRTKEELLQVFKEYTLVNV